jgi:predicted aldo/keto reductase-like oxidoreductase
MADSRSYLDNDPDLFIRKGGAAEALQEAKKQGMVRFVGFTGHKDPSIHLKMLATGFPFDSAQMPLNAFDATFRSFEQKVLPELNRRGIAAVGMKPLNGRGDAIQAWSALGRGGHSLRNEPAGHHHNYRHG